MASAEAETPPSGEAAVLNVLSGWCDEKLREEAANLDIEAGDVFSVMSASEKETHETDVKSNFDSFLEALQQEQRLVIDENKQEDIANVFFECVMDVARIRALSEVFDTDSGTSWVDLFGVRAVATNSITSIRGATVDLTDEWIFNIGWHFAEKLIDCAGEEAESVDGDSDEPVEESDSEEGEEEEESDSGSRSLDSESSSEEDEKEDKEDDAEADADDVAGPGLPGASDAESQPAPAAQRVTPTLELTPQQVLSV